MSLKNKTINGLKWSFLENIANQIVHFVIGIVLARLLSPAEFGMIGMITVFIAVSQSLVDSGFSQALIRKQDCTQTDFSTVFVTNLGIGIFMYVVLFFSAGLISSFYKTPELLLLTRVMGLNLIINSFGLVEMAIITKNVEFKSLAKISLVSTIASGLLGVCMAFLGFGYWSLVYRTISQNLIRVVLLKYHSKWKLAVRFSIESFKGLFNFGYKLLLSGLLYQLYRNIYYAVIGKYFSAAELGLYTKAEQFKNLPSSNLDSTIQRVTYPVMAKISHDQARLKSGYKKLIKQTFFITSLLLLFMAAIAREFVILTIGTKWQGTILYLQLICVAGIIYPLQTLNLNMLKTMNRSDLFLKLEILKKILVVPTILLGIKFGMIVMLSGMIVNSLIAYLINSFWSAKLLDYSNREQLLDVLPIFLETSAIAFLVWAAGVPLVTQLYLSAAVKVLVLIACLISSKYLLKIPELLELTDIFRKEANQIFARLRVRYSTR